MTRILRALALLVLCIQFTPVSAEEKRPNILWISCEDISPNLGCYGDKHASTPNLDKLAKEGAKFTCAFVPAPVCAVTRSGIITGMYPPTIGSQHMRSRIIPPSYVKCFPEYLRAKGYYCTNRSKTDYQFEPTLTAWDRNGRNHDDWRGRAKGQPFFSVINLTVCHESQIRHGEARHKQILKNLKPGQKHDPDKVADTLPKYLPDTPAARKNWAYYHDNISEMDRQAGEILKKLDEDGLRDNTLVVFWSDHGMGMPRGKRWLYDTGTLVPMIMRWPGKIEPDSIRQDLVTLIDLPPTMLNVAGLEVPKHFHGRILLGERRGREPDYLFFHRDRMDEGMDMFRAVRDRRYKYIRNFEPEKPYAQGIDYMDKMPAMIDWRRLAKEGKLMGGQKNWHVKHKPVEELYDTEKDPWELNNLAKDPAQQRRLATMRLALERWQVDMGDLGLVPEAVLMHRMKPGGKTPQTEAPIVIVTQSKEARIVSMNSTTKGASIAYRVKDKVSQKPAWNLYVGPVKVKPGQFVETVSCRVGFRDSKAVQKQIK